MLEQRQIQQIIEATEKHIQLAEQQFGKSLPKYEISFDVQGASWGYFVRQGRQRRIRYNAELFERHFDEGIKDTVPHEVAHFVVDTFFRRQRPKPHGQEWRAVMASFGIENPRATHTTDLTGINRRQQRRFEYLCQCGSVMLSTTRHFRILRGTSSYRCGKCGEKLVQAEV